MFLFLSLFYFFYFASVGIYIIYLPKVIYDIGYTSSEVGIIFAIAPLMRFITPFFFLKHINLTKKIFNIAVIVSLINSLFFYLTIDNFYLFLINNIILGVSLSLLLPFVETIALKELSNKYGKSRLYGSIGFIVASLVLAKFIDLENVDYTLNCYIFTTFFTTIFSLIISNYSTIQEQKNYNQSFDLWSNRYFWVSIFFMQVSFGGFYNFFTIYETSNGISLSMTSYLWSFGVICEIVIFYFQAPFLKNNLLSLIKFSIFITSIRWLLLFLYPNSLLIAFLSQSIHAFSFGLYHTATIMYLYKIYTNKKLAQQFMFGIAYGLGGSIGAVIAGITYGKYLFLYSFIFGIISYYFILIYAKLKTNITS